MNDFPHAEYGGIREDAMTEILDTKTKGNPAGEHETQRVAVTSSMARLRTLRFAREASFDAHLWMAALRREAG